MSISQKISSDITNLIYELGEIDYSKLTDNHKKVISSSISRLNEKTEDVTEKLI